MIRVALYKSKNGTWLDGTINAFSGFGGYSHAELVFSDGLSFSSTSRDAGIDGKPDGTRYKRIDYHAHPDRWTLIDVPATPQEERVLRDFCNGELGCRYDFAGCTRFAVFFWRQHETEWFCSEVVTAALQKLFVPGLPSPAQQVVRRLRGWKPWRVSPNKLADLLGDTHAPTVAGAI